MVRSSVSSEGHCVIKAWDGESGLQFLSVSVDSFMFIVTVGT